MLINSVELPYSTVRIFPESRYIETILFDHTGHVRSAPHHLKIDLETITNARELFYCDHMSGEDAVRLACWRALIEHTLLVNLVGSWIGHGPSLTVIHQANIRRAPYYLRAHEEAVAVAMQRYMNAQAMGLSSLPTALLAFRDQLNEWEAEARGVFAQALRQPRNE